MAYIPTSANGKPGGLLREVLAHKGFKELQACKKYGGPFIVCFSRKNHSPLDPRNRAENEQQNAPADVVEAPNRGGKSALRGMSRASSLAVASVLSTLDWDRLGECLHVTLTYRDEFPENKAELAAEKSFLTAILGRHVEAGVWVLEFQRRGVPHWHVLVWLCGRGRDDFVSWLAAWWAQHTGNRSPHASRVSDGSQHRGTWYLAMHAAKRAQPAPYPCGRMWGYVQRDKVLGALDISSEGEISERERVWWARLYRRATGGRVRSGAGFRWFLSRKAQGVLGGWVRERRELERKEGRKPALPPF